MGEARRRLSVTAMRVFGALPETARRLVVRTVTPTWTAGSMAIVQRDDGRWLMVQAVYRRGWSFPGGLLDRGEHPERAIHRELREELGLAVVLEPDPWVVVDTVLRRFDVVFLARPAPGVDPDAVKVQSPELRASGWFDPDEVPDLEGETTDALLLRERVNDGGGTILFV